LRFVLTGAEYSEAFVNGESNWANASRGWLTGMALAKTGNGGTIVGRLVSIVMGSGHLCVDLIRRIDLSTLASRRKAGEDGLGKYQSAMNSIPSSRPPTKAK